MEILEFSIRLIIMCTFRQDKYTFFFAYFFNIKKRKPCFHFICSLEISSVLLQPQSKRQVYIALKLQ